MPRPEALSRIGPNLWELPADYKDGMRVPARVVASEKLIDSMDPGVFDQVSNVAALPGIVDAAYCMPDGHWGYGFPIGGVAGMAGLAEEAGGAYKNIDDVVAAVTDAGISRPVARLKPVGNVKG